MIIIIYGDMSHTNTSWKNFWLKRIWRKIRTTNLKSGWRWKIASSKQWTKLYQLKKLLSKEWFWPNLHHEGELGYEFSNTFPDTLWSPFCHWWIRNFTKYPGMKSFGEIWWWKSTTTETLFRSTSAPHGAKLTSNYHLIAVLDVESLYPRTSSSNDHS